MSKIKENKTRHVQISQRFFLFTKYSSISMTFKIYFLMRFISKMNNQIIIKIFQKRLLHLEQQSHIMLFKVSIGTIYQWRRTSI